MSKLMYPHGGFNTQKFVKLEPEPFGVEEPLALSSPTMWVSESTESLPCALPFSQFLCLLIISGFTHSTYLLCVLARTWGIYSNKAVPAVSSDIFQHHGIVQLVLLSVLFPHTFHVNIMFYVPIMWLSPLRLVIAYNTLIQQTLNCKRWC